jgi:hypothetical protein
MEEKTTMKKRKQDDNDNPRGAGPPEATAPMSIKEIARHIATLVVHQHRRLKARDSEKGGENA